MMRAMAVQKPDAAAYEVTAEDWYLGEQERRFDRIVEILKQERARVPWLEFGALGGGFACMCADALGHARTEMTCCDVTPRLLERAAARGFATATWDLENGIRPTTLVPGTFQTILFCEIVEHLVAPDRTLPPVIELLAPGGLLLFTTPNLASFGNRLRLLRGRTPSLAPAPGFDVKAPGSLATNDHLRVCVTEEWVFLLKSLGLEVTRIAGCTNAPRARASSLRRRISVGLNYLFERIPGRLWQGTVIVARKRL
jgi:2-polyprenyl-3-methyl-5-hydroxy-6-metoxy-1,4-benzoquinol methylase